MSKATKIYESFNRAKTSVRYHIIFSTKFRKKCLTEIRESVLESFKEAESVSDFKILCMELDKDHIHLLMRWKPNLSITQVVRRLKQLTTKSLWGKEEKHLRRFYWGEKHLWTGGYFCSTIGKVSEKTIKQYIENPRITESDSSARLKTEQLSRFRFCKIKTLKPLITQDSDKRISMALAKDIVNGIIKV